ncbi:MAG: 2-dehydropantoate 2-reductase, partial [Chloroflexi bacterium]|nr:2-dehydropantoate 2-reductase [Chloroflexota bacterium]
CRGAHMEAIRKNGLKVIARDGELMARPSVVTDAPAEMGTVDVALFCVKGYDLLQVARSMSVAISPRTVVIPLGNGVDNDETLKQGLRTGDVLNGCAYISTHVEAPGVVEQTGGSRKLFFGNPDGTTEPYRPIEGMLKAAGIDAALTGNILREVWTKFIFIGPVSGVTSLHGVMIGQALDDPGLRTQLSGMMSEVGALARKKGVELPEDIVEQALGKAGAFPGDTKSSMQLDVESGRRTELETMLGYVVRQGRELGVPTPLHSDAYESLKQRVA